MCSVAFWTIGTIVVLPFAIIDIPCIVWMIFMIHKSKKLKLVNKTYDETKVSLQNSKTFLIMKEYDYKIWLHKPR